MLFEKIQLEPGEETLKVVRKHWFVLLASIFGSFVMLFLPFFILFILAVFPDLLTTMHISLAHYTQIITFSVAGWSVLCLMIGFMIWTHYYLDLWIITDRRIIMVDQIHFFNRSVSIFRLERLQDLEFSIKGILPTLLNFGTISAQTAGSLEGNFKSDGLPDPRNLQSIIQQAMDKRLAAIHNNPDLL